MARQVRKLPDKKIEWQTVVNIKSDILFMSLNALGVERRFMRKALDIDYEFLTFYHFDNTVAYSSKELETLFKLISKKIKKDKRYLFELPERTYSFADDLLGFARKVSRRSALNKLTGKKLDSLFKNYLEKCSNAFPFLLISIPVEIIITGELEAVVRNKLKSQKKLKTFEQRMQELTQFSVKETYFQKDYRRLLKIGKEIQKDNKLLEKFKKEKGKGILVYLKKTNKEWYNKLNTHNKSYAWINMYGFRRHPFTLEEVVGKLKDILEKDCKKELLKINNKRIKSEKDYRNAIKELSIKGELKKKVELLPELVYLRTYRFDIFTLSAYLVRNLFAELASRLGISIDELTNLTLWEISDILLDRKSLKDIPIKRRIEDHADIMVGGQFEVIIDKKRLEKLRREKKKKEVKKVDLVKGSVASKGRVKGPAKIVMHPTQITKVEKGDVLIAPMTSPDFVVGMLKAVAIVTDHGGITSHAAIVSRELGVPCVVGTRIATKVFVDGDLIDVDAENGIVKKLKH